jgi:hypothetical protein
MSCWSGGEGDPGSSFADRRRRSPRCGALTVLAAVLLLGACGGPVDRSRAEACIRDAFDSRNAMTAEFAGFFGEKRFFPKLTVSAIRLDACREVDVATHRCLVEYRVAIEGGETSVKSLLTMLRSLDGTGDDDLLQAHWLFTAGPRSFTCRRD